MTRKVRNGIAFAIILVFLLSCFTGCQSNNDKVNETSAENVVTDEVITQPLEEEDETKEVQEEPTETKEENVEQEVEDDGIVVPTFEVEKKQIEMNDALQFVENMRVGWNLGNTFDAYSETSVSNEMSIESSWVGVKTTKDMILAIKDAGFQTIRIPVSWHNHVSGDNYIISEQWLNRVKEVVDYAYEEGMYVILNIHHDTMHGYYYPVKDELESSAYYMECIWTQLAQTFQDYDEHLIFESINEPRMKDTNYEWWIDKSKTECIESIECINELNQVFVDVVRKFGGNNATRYLMVPGYDASPEYALYSEFTLPTDIETNEHKIIVSVHAYTPYSFALQSMSESGSKKEFSIEHKKGTTDIDSFMNRLYDKFISKGIPVVIGEFGAMDKSGNLQSRVEFTAYYLAYARACGMSCLWWDNNNFGPTGEIFGLYSRKSMRWRYSEIVDALIEYSK